MSNENVIREKLSQAIERMKECVPMLDEMKGVIPTDILSMLDTINKYSVLY